VLSARGLLCPYAVLLLPLNTRRHTQLTDDEFDRLAGNRDQLIGKIQERYGIARDEAELQVKDWEGRQ